MIGRFIASWIIRAALRRPYHHLDGYMERWWLLGGSDPGRDERDEAARGWRRAWLDSFIGRYIGACVHHVLRSDNDRHLHDHRWPSVSIVLSGGYWEVTPGDRNQHPSDDVFRYVRRWHGPGSVIFRRAKDRHRLELPAGQTAWTLFLMIGKPKDWGFYTSHGWVSATRYDEYQKAPEHERGAIAWSL